MKRELQGPTGFGRVTTEDVVHKFGRSDNIGTTYSPVAFGEVYRTQQVSGATELRVKAGDANDDAAGSGAREITLVGLDATGAQVVETLATAGATASANTSTQFIRLYRAWVSASGTYATTSVGSHADTIVIENAAGTEDWVSIASDGYNHGQTEVAAFTVPLGKTLIISRIELNVDSSKAVSILLTKRENILETTAPYSALRIQASYVGLSGDVAVVSDFPRVFDELTDVIVMAKVATSTADVSAELHGALLAAE